MYGIFDTSLQNRKCGEDKCFFEFLGDCEIPMHPISVEVAKKAAEIRGQYPHFKTMDCLQLAVACIYACDMFLTNDNQLRQFKEVRCITVEELKKNLS
jgi:predicted nucleic acid-binding protein